MKIDVPMPPGIAKLPRDKKGYPVPFFVMWFKGEPDHRIADERKAKRCAHERLCWICGDKLGRWIAFIGGPQSCTNRMFSDGPMHLECALFSVQICPHLASPIAKRRNDARKLMAKCAPGHIEERPQHFGVYVCQQFTMLRPDGDSYLFAAGPDFEMHWFLGKTPCEPPPEFS